MKKFLILALAFVSATLNAQVNTKELCDSVVAVNADGTPSYKTQNTYDENGYMSNATTYIWNGHEYAFQDMRDLVNDERGNQLTNIYTYYNDISGSFTTKIESTYNNQNVPTSNASYTWSYSDKTWSGDTKEVFEFDENGFSTKYIRYSWMNDDWVESSYDVYTNDANGRCLGSVSYEVVNGQAVVMSSVVDAYDDNGYRISETKLNVAGEETEKNVYEYDENGGYICDTYQKVDGEWVLSSRMENYNDATNTQSGNAWYFVEDGNLVGASKTMYNFNDVGNMTEWTSYIWGAGEWISASCVVMNYNSNNNVTSEEHYNIDGDGNKMLTLTCTYYYSQHPVAAINNVMASTARKDNAAYNIFGQRISVNAKGFVIKNGKKYFVK